MDRLDAMHMFVRVVETGSFKVAREDRDQAGRGHGGAAQGAPFEPQHARREPDRAGHAVLREMQGHRERRGRAENVVGAPAPGAGPAAHRQLGGLRAARGDPAGVDFMQLQPQVEVDLGFEDRYTDLVASGIDVALRLGELADSTLGAPWA